MCHVQLYVRLRAISKTVSEPKHRHLTFPKLHMLVKLKEFADDNFKFDENGRKFSKRVENTEETGAIAHYSNFSYSHNVFKRLVLQTHKIQGLFGHELNNKTIFRLS